MAEGGSASDALALMKAQQSRNPVREDRTMSKGQKGTRKHVVFGVLKAGTRITWTLDSKREQAGEKIEGARKGWRRVGA